MSELVCYMENWGKSLGGRKKADRVALRWLRGSRCIVAQRRRPDGSTEKAYLYANPVDLAAFALGAMTFDVFEEAFVDEDDQKKAFELYAAFKNAAAVLREQRRSGLSKDAGYYDEPRKTCTT